MQFDYVGISNAYDRMGIERLVAIRCQKLGIKPTGTIFTEFYTTNSGRSYNVRCKVTIPVRDQTLTLRYWHSGKGIKSAGWRLGDKQSRKRLEAV